MAYRAINVWNESKKRAAIGLGDDSIPPVPPGGYNIVNADGSISAPASPMALPSNLNPIGINSQYAQELVSGSFLPGVTGPSLFSGITNLLTGRPIAVSAVPNPASVTAAVNSPPPSIPSWVVYAGIGIVVLVLLKTAEG